MTIVMEDLMENARLARELALMGNYDSSGIYYEILVETLQKFMLNMNDPSKKGRWAVIQQQIVKEHNKLRELQKTLVGITMDLQSMPIQSKIQPSPYYASPNHYVDESPTKDFNWFGNNKPQQHHNDERWADPHIFGPPSGPPPSISNKNNPKLKNKVETNRKNTATRTTSSNNKKNINSAPPGKIGNSKPGSSASNRRATTTGDKEKSDKEKADETNEEENAEPQDDERKFEASNHQVNFILL